MNKVIFDNQCSLCIDIKNKLERLDRKKIFLWISSEKYMQSERIHPKINQRIINTTLIVINNKNDIITEFFACRFILSKIPFFYPIIAFLYIPFLSSYIGNKVYRNIAESRKCTL